jgi:hypothetical protein
MTNQEPWPSAPPPREDPRSMMTPVEWMPQLDVDGPRPQRRWTILLRWLFAVPHFVILLFYGIAAFFVMIVGWFAALFTGRLPDGIGFFLAGFLAYETRLLAYAMLLVDEYPPFEFGVTAPGYPVAIELYKTPLNPLAVLFRIILAIPAAIVAGVVTSGWLIVAFFIWIAALILGRLPDAVFQATAAAERYNMRYHAYFSMLTAVYPKRLFGDDNLPLLTDQRSPTRPLILTNAAKALVIVFIVLGAIGEILRSTGDNGMDYSSPKPRQPVVNAEVVNAEVVNAGVANANVANSAGPISAAAPDGSAP